MAQTLEDIEHIPKNMLAPNDICEYLEADPQNIRLQAQQDPTKLGFPVSIVGSRVKIPKDAFIFWCKFGRPVYTTEEKGLLEYHKKSAPHQSGNSDRELKEKIL